MTKLFAPILAFTCDEIWQAMPHRRGDDVRNVVLNEMNQPFAAYALEPFDQVRREFCRLPPLPVRAAGRLLSPEVKAAIRKKLK